MTRHISTNVSSRLCSVSSHWERLYNKYHTCCDVSFTKTSERCYICGIFFDVSRHRIDTNQPMHISWLKLLVSVINELSCMNLVST